MRPRLALVAALLWLGMLTTLAFLAAPSAFAVLPHEEAGRVASRFFKQEAYVSLAWGALLLACLGRAPGKLGASPVRVETALTLSAVFCTAGYFALQPLLAAARAGQTAWPFAAWHGVSMALFAVKMALVGTVGWRLSAVRLS